MINETVQHSVPQVEAWASMRLRGIPCVLYNVLACRSCNRETKYSEETENPPLISGDPRYIVISLHDSDAV